MPELCLICYSEPEPFPTICKRLPRRDDIVINKNVMIYPEGSFGEENKAERCKTPSKHLVFFFLLKQLSYHARKLAFFPQPPTHPGTGGR